MTVRFLMPAHDIKYLRLRGLFMGSSGLLLLCNMLEHGMCWHVSLDWALPRENVEDSSRVGPTHMHVASAPWLAVPVSLYFSLLPLLSGVPSSTGPGMSRCRSTCAQ